MSEKQRAHAERQRQAAMQRWRRIAMLMRAGDGPTEIGRGFGISRQAAWLVMQKVRREGLV